MSQRTDRVDELLRQEITAIVARDVADPRVGFITVTDVETTPDLRHARVWVSVIGQPEERDASIAALRHAMPFVRHELGRRIRLRRIPELHVRLDDTAERGTRVLRLLDHLDDDAPMPNADGRAAEPASPPAEPLPTPVARVPHAGDPPAERDPEAGETAPPTRPVRRRKPR